jgi:curved DNA-binding protein CbpA
MISHYDTLEISRLASREEIRSAYRRLALRHHPDRAAGDKEEAARRFLEIQAAYEVLSDPGRRRRYDRSLAVDLPEERLAGQSRSETGQITFREPSSTPSTSSSGFPWWGWPAGAAIILGWVALPILVGVGGAMEAFPWPLGFVFLALGSWLLVLAGRALNGRDRG